MNTTTVALIDDKTCTRCGDDWPAEIEFFRSQPKPGNPHRLAPWCRACEADQKREVRAAQKEGGARHG